MWTDLGVCVWNGVYRRSYENTDVHWPPPNVDEKTNNRNESISSRTGDRGGSPYTFYYCFVFTPNYNFRNNTVHICAYYKSIKTYVHIYTVVGPTMTTQAKSVLRVHTATPMRLLFDVFLHARVYIYIYTYFLNIYSF